MNPIVLRIARWSGVLVALAFVQIFVVRLIAVDGILPDIVLIAVVFIALREGQLWGTIAGFAAGLLLDLSVGELVGISALAKTVAGFIAGYFYDDQRLTVFHQQYRFVVVMLVAAAVHGVLYYGVYIHHFDVSIVRDLVVFSIGSTVYTGMFALVMVLITSRLTTRIRVS